MTDLVKYDAALLAIAECKAIDEVKTWADKAAAMQAYGRMAKDKTLEIDAAEIRIYSERRLGEMLAEQKSTGPGLHRGGRPSKTAHSKGAVLPPTLQQAGIDQNLSARSQKLAAVPAAEFEKLVGEWRDRVSADGERVSAKLLKAAKPSAAPKQPAKTAKADKPEKPAKPSKATKPEPPPPPDDTDELRGAMDALAERNRHLEDRLAVEAMDASEEERTAATELIAALRSEIAILKAENKALKDTRNSLMAEAAQLKQQCASWRRKAEKAEKAAKVAA